MDDADGCDEHSNRPAVMLIIRYLVFISDLDFLAKRLFLIKYALRKLWPPICQENNSKGLVMINQVLFQEVSVLSERPQSPSYR